MSNWQQRESYLTDVAERCLRGHKSFDLRRSHLVEASQISKGTIYNHFPSEADLMVTVATAHFKKRLERAAIDESQYQDCLTRFLMHHCWGIRDDLLYNRFIISRVMPNSELLEQATDDNRCAFGQAYGDYIEWNRQLIKAVGIVEGFNRAELVANYLRGAHINCDDAGKHYNDANLYHQFSYALAQLMGHSDKRIPKLSDYINWLASLEATASAA
ncbi:TetR family transcriptional regulator [Shewanella sp. Choline-02u-19]|jgi:AcrR family transcriptional regulator|uniref:TetR/AcrR family transcriptional regulator n=1 Tax=unclassified Shewanella TaxID=196818 RepID=UPI000C32B672|nr:MULTISPECIES: TetR/AcrR family transcriptional regulator [unclassified Shewanella]PKG55448.1 TetR family transcriptional regulator [Shewanella sp. GutDb-MelDb]PKG75349.1 TetR family transcriptional regulator [Shewanella sp. GutCb]PKH59369.1 TetR family transcriptional regulator [Shewanella sp. Bg11-22]PKI29255.1 TetR family transcriptional regulator [Shewanella sp. Choline-02u-19]